MYHYVSFFDVLTPIVLVKSVFFLDFQLGERMISGLCDVCTKRKLVEDATCVSMWRMIQAVNICFSMSTGMSLEMHHHVSFWISQRPRFKAMLMEKWHLTQRIYSKDILFSRPKWEISCSRECPVPHQRSIPIYIYTNTCIDQLIKLISRKHAKCWLTSGSLHFTLGSYMRSF